MKKLIVANWKMNGSQSMCEQFKKINFALSQTHEIVVCPPYPYINMLPNNVSVGAQDVSSIDKESGAFTGEISAHMLNELGCKYVLVGHSERRSIFEEKSEILRWKINAALHAGLEPIICVGEALDDYNNGKGQEFVASQLMDLFTTGIAPTKLIVAYEPIWAIGTGKTPQAEEIVAMHQFIAECIKDIDKVFKLNLANNYQILYGGSVNITNAKAIYDLTEVGGLLIGGASIKFQEFSEIVESCR